MASSKSVDKKLTFNLKWIIAFICGILILAHFISSFFPKSRLWGINHLAYFPLWIRVIVTLLGLSVLLPWLNERINVTLRKFLDFVQKVFSRRRYFWYLIFSLASVGIFYLLRDQTHFLGDGAQIISLLEKGKLHIKWTEPLEIFVHLYVYSFVSLFLKIGAGTLYSWISIFAGAIFVFFLFLFSELLGKDKEEGVLVFMLLGSMGSLQLFCGYVEHYTILYLALISYLYFSLRFLENKCGFLPVPIFFFLSIFSHFSAVYLFPSIIFLLWTGFEIKDKKIKRYLRWIIFGLSFFLLLGFLLFYLRNKWMLGQVFVPLHPGSYYAPDYTLFSLPHFLDFFSLQLLLSPVGLILLLALISYRNKKGKVLITLNGRLLNFLIIVSFFQLAYGFLLNPGLGMARDWDLFSASALGYTLLGIYFLIKVIKDKKTFKYVSTVLIFTSLFSTLPWILINHNPQLSIKRFRDLLELDLKKSRNGRFILEQYFSVRGMKEEKDKESKLFWEKFPEFDLTERGLEYFRAGKIEEAIPFLQKAIQIEPGLAEAHNFLGLAYYNKGKISKAELEYLEAIKLRPDYVKSYINLGHLYTSKNEVEKAIKVYERAVKLKTEEPEVYNNLGLFYLAKNKLSKAKSSIQKAIALRADSHIFYLSLGLILVRSGSTDEAEEAFLKSIQLKSDYYLAHYYLTQLYLTRGEKLKAEKEYELFLKYKPENFILPQDYTDTTYFNPK